jgi:hypothetical protein
MIYLPTVATTHLSVSSQGRITMRSRRQLGDRPDPWEAPDPALALAEQQMRWHGHHRDLSRIAYQVNEVLILLATASTTRAAALRADA